MNHNSFLWNILSCAITVLLILSVGCIDSPQNHPVPEINPVPPTTPIQSGDDFSVIIQINGSPQTYHYRDLNQQNYTIIPILYSQDSPNYIYLAKPCWSENIPKTMDIFLQDSDIKQKLRNGCVIVGLDYYIQPHCVNPTCPPCAGEGPELRILAHNTTERYILMNASSNAPWITGPIY